MPETNNYNLYKPESGESGWAQMLNNNFDIIDTQIKSVHDSIANHTGSGNNKHNASQISTTDGSDVESKLSTLFSSKADNAHTHNYASTSHAHGTDSVKNNQGTSLTSILSQYDNRLGSIENTLKFLDPDLSHVTVSAFITNQTSGIRIMCSLVPLINIHNWNVRIVKAGRTLAEVTSASSFIFIAEDSLEGINDGDIVEILVTAFSGQSSQTTAYSHKYEHISSHVEERLISIEQQLTIGNIIDAFAQDADALQALANVLHSSNTLAQKIAELR